MPALISQTATANPSLKPLLAIICGAIAIGFAPIFVRLSEVGPFATGFWRMALALPLFSLLWLMLPKPQSPSVPIYKPTAYLGVIGSGVLFGLMAAIWNVSVYQTTVANATMLINCAPLLVVMWGCLRYKKMPKLMVALGVACTLSGGVLLVGPHFELNNPHLKGDFCGLLAAVFLAFYMLVLSHVRKYFSTLACMTWSALSASCTLFIIAYFAGESLSVNTFSCWAALAGLAAISQFLGQGLIAFSSRHLPVTFSSAALIIQPVVAAIVSWLLFEEGMNTWQLFGIVIALAGIYLVKIDS